MAERPLLLLVDGHSLAFRSFYAFAKRGVGGLATKDGVPTSVTYGFLKALLGACDGLRPQGVTVAFDTGEVTFRHGADPNYKAHREEAPESFFEDLANLQSILERDLEIPLVSMSGFEADDVLGTMADRAAQAGWRVRILSGDRDLFQLVDDGRDIAVLYMGGGPSARSGKPSLITREGVVRKLGVTPEEVVELKALTGDSSDNIPGVRGVGSKTATILLSENGDLDGIYAALDSLEGEKAAKGAIKGTLKGRLARDRDQAYLSRLLARIRTDVPLPKSASWERGLVQRESLRDHLRALELHSLARQMDRFTELFSVDGVGGGGSTAAPSPPDRPRHTPAGVIKEPPETAQTTSSLLEPARITSLDALQGLVGRLMSCCDPSQPVAFDTETTDLNPFRAELVGVGVCWGEAHQDLAYIPIGHVESSGQLPLERVLKALAPWLASRRHPKALQNAKYDRLILLRHGLVMDGVVIDTMLADYLRDSAARHNLETMAKRCFGFRPPSYGDLVGKGQSFADVPISKAEMYCGMDVHLTRRLALLLRAELQEMGEALIPLLDGVELPLEPVLACMEATGIRIDVPYLEGLSREWHANLDELQSRVQQAAGTAFNLASPKQLGELLFDTLDLDRRKSRRTKTGWSTDSAVLERLQDDHPVVPLVLEHRTLSKLLTTYVDALPALVEQETGRVHTDFNQAVTATGRLSSSNPNLQNIPVRTEFSRRIRRAFLPREGWQLLSADYSQIELRILAHLSGEPLLLEAYRNGEDVHALTARLLLDSDSVSDADRRLGKTINFGVIYGMGAKRFARQTGVSQAEAKEFLRRYRERYPCVFLFLELQERLALSRGYVETILRRRRPFHFDQSGLGRWLGRDPMDVDLQRARCGGLEAQQLRAAANAPIQGSSADIIKLAMVALQRYLQDQDLPARLLLQVHDELVLEVAPEATDVVVPLVRRTMEKAARLEVPLVVETGLGASWMDAK